MKLCKDCKYCHAFRGPNFAPINKCQRPIGISRVTGEPSHQSFYAEEERCHGIHYILGEMHMKCGPEATFWEEKAVPVAPTKPISEKSKSPWWIRMMAK